MPQDMNDEEKVNVLVGLGLTSLQAKIYLALMKSGCTPVSVKALSSLSKVVRQDTYRVLTVLQERGLAEKILGDVTMYRCIPIKSGIKKLLKQKSEEYSQVKKKTEYMLNHFENNFVDIEHEILNLNFSLTTNLELLIQKLKKEISQTKSTVDIQYQPERMSTVAFYLIEDFEKAILRGVKIRLITTQFSVRESDNNLRELLKLDAAQDALEIRYIQERPEVGLSIFDKKSCYIRVSSSLGHSLCTTNQNVAYLANAYFANLWDKGTKVLRNT